MVTALFFGFIHQVGHHWFQGISQLGLPIVGKSGQEPGVVFPLGVSVTVVVHLPLRFCSTILLIAKIGSWVVDAAGRLNGNTQLVVDTPQGGETQVCNVPWNESCETRKSYAVYKNVIDTERER